MKKGLLANRWLLRVGTSSSRSGSNTSPIYFNLNSFLRLLLLIGVAFFCLQVYGQSTGAKADDTAYRKVITERSKKILSPLSLTDSDRYQKVLDILVGQYLAVNTIHDNNKRLISDIKAKPISKGDMAVALKEQDDKKTALLSARHEEFINELSRYLDENQIDKIKDGMTYNVLNVTYGAYQDMIPTLTDAQKQKIYGWLKEARELAMDEGSSDDKHKMFGKYKGRINNYLSAEGYDMKKEEKAWQERIKNAN